MTKARTLADLDASGVLTSASTLNPANLYDTGNIPSALLAGVGGGIDVAEQWRLNGNVTIAGSGVNILTTLWEASDNATSGSLGNSLTESNGVFAFPETGIYYIAFSLFTNLENDEYHMKGVIQGTTDNSTYETLAESSCGIERSGGSYQFSGTSHVLFDCTDTATHKVRFGYNPALAPANSTIMGNSTKNMTSFICIKLGDT